MTLTCPDALLPDAIDEVVDRNTATDLLQPIDTEAVYLLDGKLPYVVKWITPNAARQHRDKPKRSSTHNPFLPPEPELTLATMGEDHLVVLNKFPVMRRHLLVITRHFEAQTSALTDADFTALAPIIAAHGGLGFYNGGADAGASQDHKHLQWIPDLPPLARVLPQLLGDTEIDLGFRHAFAPLEPGLFEQAGAGARLGAHYRGLLDALRISPERRKLPPYNLLLTRHWMWLVPRSAERWERMSVNALGFAGSLFIKRPEHLPALEAIGLGGVLRAVATPT